MNMRLGKLPEINLVMFSLFIIYSLTACRDDDNYNDD